MLRQVLLAEANQAVDHLAGKPFAGRWSRLSSTIDMHLRLHQLGGPSPATTRLTEPPLDLDRTAAFGEQ